MCAGCVLQTVGWFAYQRISALFKPGKPGFLQLFLYADICMCACLCVCPSPMLLITSGMMWYDRDHIWLVKQVVQLLYGNCTVSLKGVVFALICVVESNPVKLSKCYVRCLFTITIVKSICTLETWWSSSVIKVGVVCMNVCILRHLLKDLAIAIDIIFSE